MKINKGLKKPQGLRVGIYGVEGIGKSTLAANLDRPLFVDVEKGTGGLDVSRVEGISLTLAGMLGAIEELRRDPSHMGYQTLVIDTADALEQKLVWELLTEKDVKSLEEVGKYGRGWTEVGERFCRILDALTNLASTGMDTVVIAHAMMRKQELPEETDAFDRYELKLSKQVAPKVKEWADLLLFVNYRLDVISQKRDFGRTEKKATGGQRIVFADHRPTYDAKRRAGITFPDECSLDDATKLLPKAIEQAVDRGTGSEPVVAKSATTPTVAKSATVEKTSKLPASYQQVKPETKAEPKVEPKAEPANADADVLYDELRTLMNQYGLTDDEIREYIRSKKICGEPVWEVDDIPLKWCKWLIGGMNKIAPKIYAKRGN